jgi:hypothetical protein
MARSSCTVNWAYLKTAFKCEKTTGKRPASRDSTSSDIRTPYFLPLYGDIMGSPFTIHMTPAFGTITIIQFDSIIIIN